MSKIDVIIFVGGSGTGKTTLVDYMIEKGIVQKHITCTTRLPRVNETNGVDYHFLTKDELLEKHKNKELIEPPANFSGNYYACPIPDKNAKKPVAIILEYAGVKEASKVLSNNPDFNLKTVFLNPLPENEIRKRMLSQKRTDKEISERIESMKDEVEWTNFDYTIRLTTDTGLDKDNQLKLHADEVSKILSLKKEIKRKPNAKKNRI